MIEFLTNYSITHWSCCRNSHPLWNPPHPGLQRLEMSLVLHTEIKFLSFFFFVLLMKALDFSENTEISVKPHIISSVFMSWVQKRESEVSCKLGRWRKTRTNIYRNFWWGSEVPKIHPNFPQRTNVPVKPEGKKSERDSDRGGKCSGCDKQRGLNWGEKNLIR